MASPNPMPKKFLQIIHRGKPADDVPYTEFHNDGEPSPNLGELGDVYIDTTSAKISMYGKLKTGWVKWAGPETQYLPYMPHPTIQGLILWCNPDIGAIGWRARAKVSSLSEYPSTSIMLASALNKRTEKKRKQPSEPSRFTGNPPGKRSNTSVTTNSINNHPSWDNHSGHGLQVGYASLPQQMMPPESSFSTSHASTSFTSNTSPNAFLVNGRSLFENLLSGSPVSPQLNQSGPSSNQHATSISLTSEHPSGTNQYPINFTGLSQHINSLANAGGVRGLYDISFGLMQKLQQMTLGANAVKQASVHLVVENQALLELKKGEELLRIKAERDATMLRDLCVDMLDLDIHQTVADDEALLARLKARVREIKEQRSRLSLAEIECSRLRVEKEERIEAERSLWEAVQGHSEDGSAPSSIEVLEHALHQIQHLRQENESLKLVEEAREDPVSAYSDMSVMTEINYTTNQGSITAINSQSPLRDEETTDTEHEETFYSPECSLCTHEPAMTSQLEEVELELASPEYPVSTLPGNHILERQHSPDVQEGFKSLDPSSEHKTEDILTEEQLNAIFRQIDDRKLCTICLTGSIEEYIEIPPSHDELRVVLTQHCVTKHGDILDLLRGLTADEIV